MGGRPLQVRETGPTGYFAPIDRARATGLIVLPLGRLLRRDKRIPMIPRRNSIESQPSFPPVQGRKVGPENVGQRAWTPDSQPPLPPVQGREVGPENAGTLPYGQPEARPSTAPAPPYEQNFPTGQVMTGRVPEMLVPTTQMPVDERNLPIPEARPSTVIPSQVMTGRVPEMKTPVAGGDERTQPAGANVPSAAATPASATQPSAAAIPMRPGWGMIERPNIDQAGGGRGGGGRRRWARSTSVLFGGQTRRWRQGRNQPQRQRRNRHSPQRWPVTHNLRLRRRPARVSRHSR